ncbi:MAG: hypothetical protein ACUVTY_02745 [Armatimonadota bacterium]
MRQGIAKGVLLVLSLLWLVPLAVGMSACGKKEEPQAEGYYEGPMLPKGQRTGGPAQGTQ